LQTPGWYYFGPKEQGLMVRVLNFLRNARFFQLWLAFFQPKYPTLSAFGRASTISLGSIAFGSLIVTLLEIIRIILNVARNNASADGHRTFFVSPVTINSYRSLGF
jgi:hypothetical protein